MLNGTWPQIHQIKISQSPRFSNSPNFSPSKISCYYDSINQDCLHHLACMQNKAVIDLLYDL